MSCYLTLKLSFNRISVDKPVIAGNSTVFLWRWRVLLTGILFMATGIESYAQQSSIYGVVSVHNSKYFKGKREYIVNATVSDNFNRAQPTLTSVDGNFRLIYTNVKESETCEFDIDKEGLKVVNFTSLKAVAGQRDTIKISMATQAELNRFRNEFYNTGKTETEKYLARQLSDKNNQLRLLQNEKVKNETHINQLRLELEELSKQSEQVGEQVRNIVGKYVNINLDDESPLVSRSIDLFKQGLLDSALLLLNQLLNNTKVEDVVNRRTDISTRKKELIREEYQNNRESQDVGKALLFKADIFKTRLQLDSVAFCYQQLMRLDSSDPAYLKAYALHLEWINSYDDAISYYSRLLKVYEENKSGSLRTHAADMAYVLNRIGTVYLNKNNYQLAENFFTKSFSNGVEAFKKDSSGYEPLLADMYNSLGRLYRYRSMPKESENNYNRAAAIYTRLSKTNTELYGLALAKVQTNLGDLYNTTGDYRKGEIVLQKAIIYLNSLSHDSSDGTSVFLVNCFQNLGVSYKRLRELDKAEENLKKALQGMEKLAKNNPVVYQPQLAEKQLELGNFYRETNKYTQAEKVLLVALRIYQDISLNNEETYKPNLAKTLTILGDFYQQKDELQKAEQYILNAYTIYQALAKKQPDAFLRSTVDIKVSLGDLYKSYNKLDKAKLFYEEAQTGYEQLFRQTASEADEKDLALVEGKLADLYDSMDRPVQSAAMYKKALFTYRKLVLLERQTYEPGLAELLLSLGDFYNQQKDTLNASKVLAEAVKIYSGLYTKSQQNYGINYGFAYFNTGDLLKIERRFQEAEQSYQKALNVFKESAGRYPDIFKPYIPLALDCLGDLYIETRDLVKAEATLAQSWRLHLAEVTTNPGISNTNAGKTAIKLLRITELINDTLLKKEVQKFRPIRITTLEDTLYNLAKENPEILHELSGYYGTRAAGLLAMARFDEAEQKALQALKLQPDLLAAKTTLAHALLLGGKYDEALLHYKSLKLLKNENGKSVSAICITELERLKSTVLPNADVDKILRFLRQ